MAGQDATLSLKEAKAQQERIQAGNQNNEGHHQGPKHSGHSGHTDICEKVQHQGK